MNTAAPCHICGEFEHASRLCPSLYDALKEGFFSGGGGGGQDHDDDECVQNKKNYFMGLIFVLGRFRNSLNGLSFKL